MNNPFTSKGWLGPKGTKPLSRHQQTRALICEAAIAHLISHPQATMSDIAIAAGVGRATLYRYFPSRDALLKDLVATCIRETNSATAHIETDGLRGKAAIIECINALVPLGDKFQFLLNSWTPDHETRSQIERDHRDVETMMADAIEIGDVRSDLSPVWLSLLFDSLLTAAWDALGAGMAIDEVIDQMQRSLFEGIEIRQPARPAAVS
ncbi:MAG: TetR/AcrR family transcriptional regulator [Pseudomonadota bacterium]